MEKINIAVVGAGAVGCAIARELVMRGHKDIFVFERTQYLAEAQSGRNSGVIHGGIYYRPGSLKGRLCISGNPLMYDFCHKNDVPCVRTGKLIVATDPAEEKKIHELFEIAKKNGAQNVRMLSKKEIKEFEPNVTALSALYSPSTGSVDAAAYVKALARTAENGGAQILMRSCVTAIEPKDGGFIIEITREDGQKEYLETEILINSAGLYSDVIAKMVNPNWPHKLSPIRGEYYKFNRSKRADIAITGLNVYPAPEFLKVDGQDVMVVGIHLTPTFDFLKNGSIGIGNIVTVGPEFSPASDREDYESKRKPRRLFYEKAARFFPNIKEEDLEMDFTGIMANLGTGKDWIIERDKLHKNCIQLVGIDSPALTSSLSIARYVADVLTLP